MENFKEVFKIKFKENWKHGLLMLSYLLIVIGYNFTNQPIGTVHNLTTAFDIKTPYIAAFIIPYNVWYPFILFCMFYLLIVHRDAYYRTIIGLDIGLVICYIVFVFFQTTVQRPELIGNDFFTKIVRITYSSDRPFNCFPSIHVFTTTTMMISIFTSDKTGKIMRRSTLIIGVLIILSTLFVKQHVVMDVVGGIALSTAMYYAVRRIEEEKIVGWIKKLYSSWTMRKKLGI